MRAILCRIICAGLVCWTACGTEDSGGADGPAPPDAAADGLGVDSPDVDDGPPVWVLPDGDPADPGPYQVGYRVLDVGYEPVGGVEERQLRVALWYPTLEDAGEPSVYRDLFLRDAVWLSATPIETGSMPVLVFSHGNLAHAEQSYFLTEHFASHGWLVIAPDHTGNTMTDIVEERTNDIYLFRPQDLTAALDAVAGLPAGDPLAGSVGAVVVVSGHSFGGYTAFALAGASFDVPKLLEACKTATGDFCKGFDEDRGALFAAGFADGRVDVAIPLAPGGASLLAEGASQLGIPTQLMTATGDQSTTNAANGDPYWAALDGPVDMRVNFETGGHHTFAVTCTHFPSFGQGDGCGDGFMAPQDGYRIVRAYALAYARWHLFGDDTVVGLLDGSEILSNDVTLNAKTAERSR